MFSSVLLVAGHPDISLLVAFTLPSENVSPTCKLLFSSKHHLHKLALTSLWFRFHSCQVQQEAPTILRFLSTVAAASTRWRVRELYCQTTYRLPVAMENVCCYGNVLTESLVSNGLVSCCGTICLASRWLAMNFLPGYAIPAFGRRITIFRELRSR
jgi:hypothetical protein